MPRGVTNGPVVTATIGGSGGTGGLPPKPTHDVGKPNCPKFDAVAAGVRMASEPERTSHIDPSSRSRTNETTKALALQQTAAARKMLYDPGDALKTELAGAAGVLHDVASGLSPDNQRTLGTRILGAEGLMRFDSFEDLLGALDRVARDPVDGNATGADRQAVIALMGDIGALYADTGATTGVQSRTERAAENLRKALTAKLGVSPKAVKDTQRVGGSKTVGPKKKQERTRPAAEHTDRTGIHDTGQQIDEHLHVDEEQALPTARWDTAHIARSRVYGTTEPLVGHMSGSPAEILQVWDMLAGVRPDRQYTGTMNAQQASGGTLPMQQYSKPEQDARYARAAGAAGMLVASGYHSAVEVLEGTLAYTGQSLRGAVDRPEQDAGHVFGHGAATELIGELFEHNTATPLPNHGADLLSAMLSE